MESTNNWIVGGWWDEMIDTAFGFDDHSDIDHLITKYNLDIDDPYNPHHVIDDGYVSNDNKMIHIREDGASGSKYFSGAVTHDADGNPAQISGFMRQEDFDALSAAEKAAFTDVRHNVLKMETAFWNGKTRHIEIFTEGSERLQAYQVIIHSGDDAEPYLYNAVYDGDAYGII